MSTAEEKIKIKTYNKYRVNLSSDIVKRELGNDCEELVLMDWGKGVKH